MPEIGLQGFGQGGDPLPAALAVADLQAQSFEVDVVHAQTHHFHHAQAGTVHETGADLRHAIERIEYSVELSPAQHHGQFPRLLSEAVTGDLEICAAEHLNVEKNERVERGSLRVRRDVFTHREMGEERSHLALSHLLRISHGVELDELADPVEIGSLCAPGKMPRTDGIVDSEPEHGCVDVSAERDSICVKRRGGAGGRMISSCEINCGGIRR